jgi:hypothetical protein
MECYIVQNAAQESWALPLSSQRHLGVLGDPRESLALPCSPELPAKPVQSMGVLGHSHKSPSQPGSPGKSLGVPIAALES